MPQTDIRREIPTMFPLNLMPLTSSGFQRLRSSRAAGGRSRRSPGARSLRMESLERRTLLSVAVLESEWNGDRDNADEVPIGLEPGMESVAVVRGGIDSPGDRDWFRIELNAGDVLGGTVMGRDDLDTTVGLFADDGTLLVFNDDHWNLRWSRVIPDNSPLPRLSSYSTDSAFYYVINTSGEYFIELGSYEDSSAGKYKMDLVVARPGMEAEPVGTRQTLFVDFDGATVNAARFGGSGTRTLSPLADFLPNWGLSAADENAVIDAILTSVEENLSQDIRQKGLNGDYASSGVPGEFDIEILNSRDHADEFGSNPLVAKVVVGGTQEEFGIYTVALAEHCDPGNFQYDDLAVVMLDRLSGPPSEIASLNQFPIHPTSSKIELVGVGVASLVVHEAGHLFGNLHTSRFNDVPNLMDSGGLGGLANRIGIGPDGKFGSPDDIDVDFGVDIYAPERTLSGITDTLNTIAFGLATGKVPLGSPDTTALASTAIDPYNQPPSTAADLSGNHPFDAAWLWLAQLEDGSRAEPTRSAVPPPAEAIDLIMADLE